MKGLREISQEELHISGPADKCFGDSWNEPIFFSLKRPFHDCWMESLNGGLNCTSICKVFERITKHARAFGVGSKNFISLLGNDSKEISLQELKWVQKLLDPLRFLIRKELEERLDFGLSENFDSLEDFESFK